jgi:hypothetical protein
MDILNWLFLRASKLVRTKPANPKSDLVVLGADVTFLRRGDSYKTYGMTLTDAIQGGSIGNTKHYELDRALTDTVVVDTPRGIIDILGMGSSAPLTPDRAYNSSVEFFINNPDLDLTIANRDNIYVQYSVYYKNTITDNAIPYLIATGVSAGLGFNLYNANPASVGANNWDGDLYVYYELYTIN